MLTAITREAGSSLVNCQLTYLDRQSIDIGKAIQQHKAYEALLMRLGVHVVCLPAEPEMPDAVFVEDVAVVTNELAVMTRMGAESRRAESESLARVLSEFFPVHFLSAPATLDGGDVLRIGQTFYVGLSARTNNEGLEQLREALLPQGYDVAVVAVEACLHLKTGCTYLGRGVLLANPSWVDVSALPGLEVIPVPVDEQAAANTLTVNGTTILPGTFPHTKQLLQTRGFTIETLDISEFQKAEAGLTCMSIIFEGRN